MTAQRSDPLVPGVTRCLAALVALAAPVFAAVASLEVAVQHTGTLVALMVSVAVVTVATWYALTRRGVLRIGAVAVAVLAVTAVVLAGLSLLLLQMMLLVVASLPGALRVRLPRHGGARRLRRNAAVTRRDLAALVRLLSGRPAVPATSDR